MASSSNVTNATSSNSDFRWGWVPSGEDRGTLDIVWSCSVTIFLCCWVATHPNVGAPKDKFLQRCIDRTHLAVVGLLGPEFLFGIALGQFSSARRSVRKFKTDKVSDGIEWTYKYAFFTDMGGMFLTSDDFPQGYPINAEQLHWLVKNGHVDFPDMKKMDIGERNTSDMLSRLLTVWQALWFSIIEIQRAREGLPMTTLELTALSYVFVMLATQICWAKKPSIARPRMIPTKDGKLAEDIRTWARNNTHRDLPQEWYRTPMDFINGPRFQIDTHWLYYTRLTHLLRLPIVSRPMKSKPWDRFPSDIWLPIEKSWLAAPFGGFVLLVFSGWFLLGWNFFFPTPHEQYLWRICAVVQAVFGVYGGLYYMFEGFKWYAAYEELQKQELAAPPLRSMTSRAIAKAATKVTLAEQTIPVNTDTESQSQLGETESRSARRWRHLLPRRLVPWVEWIVERYRRVDRWLDRVRNISHDQDPGNAMRIHVIGPITVICALYTVCRAYFYLEDYLSLRVQPVGVYVTVNQYVPFWGGG
ncbi:hypothetical protein QBC47DRAFT_385512 [Echria macrotheca]|uniref:Uncharacterized protein n=1 Tax=Echria macrotheca TaxID=438768 RepID=A0AAJ0F861_9PEZI|nr:hypothetical protein QBC47DRAFT_385512 [Echria macrotheca]